MGGGTAKELGWTRLRNLGLPWAKIKSATGMSDVKLASTLKDGVCIGAACLTLP